MKILFIFGLILVISSDCLGQTDIYLREYGIYVLPKNCNDTLQKNLRDSSFIKMWLFDCKGKMSFQKFDKNGVLLLSGFYCSSLDTLKEYISRYDLADNLIEIKVHKYFEPLKDGQWSYYENSHEIKKEKYIKGVLTKKSN